MHVYPDPACAGLVTICRLQNEIKRRGTRSQPFKLYEYAMTFSTSICFIRKIGPCTRYDWSISYVIRYFTSKVWKNRASIPLTNRVRGPYRKLRNEFFPPRFMAQARSARADRKSVV